jgi:hypothetical protein
MLGGNGGINGVARIDSQPLIQVSDFLFLAGLRFSYSGLAWRCGAVIALAGTSLDDSISMSEQDGRMCVDENRDENNELG